MRKESLKRLLVRTPNWIGDAVMSEPALSAVRKLFPSAEITWLAKPAIAELFQGHPACDKVVVYEDRGRHSGITGKWALAETLRGQRYELAILLQNAFEAAMLAFLSGIPRRFGYATDGRKFLLSDPVVKPTTTRHQVDYFLDMLRPLGVEGPASAPQLYLTAQEEREMEQRLAQFGIGEADCLVGLNPGSIYGGAKRWLPDRFAETADRLVRESGAKRIRVVIVGARGEETLGQAINERMAAKPIVLSGRTSIRQLMAVIKRCSLFITNDTGPMHIAAAFSVPVVAIFGPTDWRTTAPLGAAHSIVRHEVECAPCLLRECPIDHRCMTRVTVDEVCEAALKRLRADKVAGSSGFSGSNQIDQTNPTNETSRLNKITVFLDRDGTLNRDTGYVELPQELDLLAGVVEAVARLNRERARVVLITNQSGIGRGLVSSASVDAVHARLRELLHAGGASLDGIYCCPHHPDDGCLCRKPGTLLVERAVAELGLDGTSAYVVGDQKRDVELARRIDARSVLVTTGPTSRQALADLEAERLMPDYVAVSLGEAVEWILEDAASRQPSAISIQRSGTRQRR
ncbi:lipopolysaccharide heptosyltransferase II [Nitrospiraceae bacterium AH_259_D15_M11_P09]|nr:lipopolysaccharide heptosyltransferase II [Nitrospiraceae bacterium AH_259_D15_M11_P09]